MTCVGRLPSPTPSPPSPISPMRLSSALFFFTLPTFRSPLQPVPTPFSLPLINLLGTPRPRRPGCLVYPSPPAVASCANLVQSPTNLFVVELFSMHAEELGNMTSAVSTGGGVRGGGGSKNRDSSSLRPRCTASPDFRCSSSIAFLYSTDRDYIGRVNGSDRKG